MRWDDGRAHGLRRDERRHAATKTSEPPPGRPAPRPDALTPFLSRFSPTRIALKIAARIAGTGANARNGALIVKQAGPQSTTSTAVKFIQPRWSALSGSSAAMERAAREEDTACAADTVAGIDAPE